MLDAKHRPLRIGIAGTTGNTVTCARALRTDARFEVVFVLTPDPRPIGRKQVLTANPLDHWAQEQQIPVVHVQKKLDEQVRTAVEAHATEGLDLLLVVDFGYLVPNWLLSLPRLAPLNIHPSRLPAWRGSSPGQFVLLYGETESAVTLMRMTAGLDEGPVIAQPPLKVSPTWTQREYYDAAFALISEQLAELVASYAQSCEAGAPAETPQPATSPTPLARRLTKDDGFVDWQLIQSLLDGKTEVQTGFSSPLLAEVAQAKQTPAAELIARAARALSPWPGLWTILPTAKGAKRMKLLRCSAHGASLQLETVQIEGQQEARWDEVKNVLSQE